MLEPDVNAVFCNGYAVFEHKDIDILVLQKVLNSSLMHFYVQCTSYPIEGGFWCYQKQFIQDFSIPFFSAEDLAFLQAETNQKAIDHFLCLKYGIDPALL